ncbi:SDR family oxidoreductase [Amycolatopsis sp. NPDC051903]|uniref:SDR family oxidoreductase n=1 Tax=Amycolatopsis sp. NPDC051903 TaxID=3363936 RepID=UPI0037A7C05F
MPRSSGRRACASTRLSPGAVRTAIWEAACGFVEQIPKTSGMTTGRVTEPREVAALIVVLMSEVAGNITGAGHFIDGGTIKAL